MTPISASKVSGIFNISSFFLHYSAWFMHEILKCRECIIEASILFSLIFFCGLGLDKSELIGDVGSRSFYLRKSSGTSPFNSFRSETDPDSAKESPAPSIPHPPFLLHSFISRNINKMVRRARKLWKIVVCLQWGTTSQNPWPCWSNSAYFYCITSTLDSKATILSVAFLPFMPSPFSIHLSSFYMNCKC